MARRGRRGGGGAQREGGKRRRFLTAAALPPLPPPPWLLLLDFAAALAAAFGELVPALRTFASELLRHCFYCLETKENRKRLRRNARSLPLQS
jgi:hypothetical protein